MYTPSVQSLFALLLAIVKLTLDIVHAEASRPPDRWMFEDVLITQVYTGVTAFDYRPT